LKEKLVIDHVSLGTHHYTEAVAFYQQVLKPLGVELVRDTGAEAAFGTAAQWSFFLYPISSVPTLSRQSVVS
jgi:catechol 2,3-dioxygenase-like lactoylglutathione lyase family enzyme